MQNSRGVVCILVIFPDRPMFNVQPHQWKALAETFWMIWLNIGLSWIIIKVRTNPVLFSRPCENCLKKVFFYCDFLRVRLVWSIRRQAVTWRVRISSQSSLYGISKCMSQAGREPGSVLSNYSGGPLKKTADKGPPKTRWGLHSRGTSIQL